MTEIPRVVMMIGVSRSGKSRFAAALYRMGWNVIGGNLYEEIPHEQFLQSIKEGKEVVIDRCNLTPEDRSVWFQKINKEFQDTRILQWIAVVMDTSLEECMLRSKNSSVKERNRIHRHTREFQPPRISEGFNEILHFTDFESSLERYLGNARNFSDTRHLSLTRINNDDIGSSSTALSKTRSKSRGKISLHEHDIVLLFDLNGTLTSHTKQRRASRINKLRPGVKHLLRLKERFRLGIFTSATLRTVQTVLQMFHNELGEELFEAELVFHRDHTAPISRKFAEKMGLKPWDTVKPLKRLFGDISRVVLFDDDHWKADKDEQANMVLVPSWTKEEQVDKTIEVIVNEALKTLASISESQDVRNLTRSLSNTIFDLTENMDGHESSNIVTMKDSALIHDAELKT
eukprot:g4113.t1